MRFLIARTDNIGDVVLSLPVAGLLKEAFPDCKIWFLTREYTQFIIEACPFIDGYLNWDELKTSSLPSAAEKVKSLRFDTFISLFSDKQVTQLAKIAKIKQRIATSRRIHHWFSCNRLVNFSRKKSALHEIQLNTKLLSPLGIKKNFTKKELIPYLRLTAPQNKSITDLIDPVRFNLIIHPGSNGNGREWQLQNFIKLIHQLSTEQFQIFITGTAKEQERIQPLIDACPHVNNKIGKFSLQELLSFINACDGLIASSTGPLHVAAALGKHALGLYPPKPLMGPGRWAPIGTRAEFLVTDKNCSQPCNEGQCICVNEIPLESVIARIQNWTKVKKESKQRIKDGADVSIPI